MTRRSGRARDARTPSAGSEAPGAAAGRDKLAEKAAITPALSHGQWPLMVALASLLGLLVGAAMMVLSLWSVAMPSKGVTLVATPVSTVGAAPVAAPGPVQAAPNREQSTPIASSAATFLERRTVGDPNAPVVISEWFDFQCPACGRYALTREPDLERLYVDTGKVRYVARHFPFLGPESFLAAEASLAAAEQGRYWDYRRLLFQNQKGENLGAFSADNLRRFAAELGLDQATFNARLDQATYRDPVLAEAREAQSLGVNATPTFFINNRKIEGVPTVERLGQLIEDEIARSR